MEVIVARGALLSALEAARRAWPCEFVALFRGRVQRIGGSVERVCVDELIVAPLAAYEEDGASYASHALPIAMGIVATFHSHPVRDPRPSAADLELFVREGLVHFIATPPFDERSVHAYHSNGEAVAFSIELNAPKPDASKPRSPRRRLEARVDEA